MKITIARAYARDDLSRGFNCYTRSDRRTPRAWRAACQNKDSCCCFSGLNVSSINTRAPCLLLHGGETRTPDIALLAPIPESQKFIDRKYRRSWTLLRWHVRSTDNLAARLYRPFLSRSPAYGCRSILRGNGTWSGKEFDRDTFLRARKTRKGSIIKTIESSISCSFVLFLHAYVNRR